MFPETERFSEREFLGTGALGAVYLAEDTSDETVVAIKVLNPAPPWALYRLQSEFSTLQALSHRNLVRFLELHDATEPWFITMAHIEGVRLSTWLADNPDPGALREVFCQLTRGLLALHERGLIHRNLKPGNVLIQSDGCVKLLDGGLAGLLFDPHAATDVSSTRYHSPELGSEPGVLTPAMDWYSLGVMLLEHLDTPSQHLANLCAALTHPDPSSRPDGEVVLSVLAAIRRWTPRPLLDRPFVGRTATLELLQDCFRQCAIGPSVALLMGQPGMGMTTLAQRFLAQRSAADDATVISLRCHEPSQAPFGLLNELVAALPAVEVTGLSPALPQMFPILRTWLPSDHSGELPPDPRAVRFQALDDLRALLQAATAERPLVVLVDDLHWADGISARVLTDLLTAADAPRILLLGCCPLAEETRAAFLLHFSDLRQTAEVAGWYHRISVPPLSDDDIFEMLTLQGVMDDAQRARIRSDSRGNPLFAEHLIRLGLSGTHAGPRLTLQQALTRHLSTQPPQRRRILELLAVARQPLSPELLSRILGADLTTDLRDLRVDRLIEIDPAISLAHVRIQEAVLGMAATAHHHHSLAQALMEDEADPVRICWHLLAADAPEEAIAHAITAGDRAAATLQLESAGQLYQLALEHLTADDSRRGRVAAACAAVMVRLGRATEAAPLLEEIAILRSDASWGRRAAAQWIAAGELDRGVKMLRSLLEQAGVRWPGGRTEQGLMMRLGMARLRLQSLPEGWAAADPDPEAQHRLALCHTAAQALWSVQPGRVQYLLMIGLQQALQTRSPRLAARLGLLLYTCRDLPERLVCHSLATRLDQPDLHALSHWMQAATLHAGRPAESLPYYQAAITQFEQECPEATWESQQARVGRLDALWWTGPIETIRAAWQDDLKRARHLKDQPLWCAATLCGGRLALLEGRSGRARERVSHILSRARPSAERMHAQLLGVRCALYTNQLDGIGREISALWQSIMASDLHLRPALHLHALDLRAAAVAALLLAQRQDPPPAGGMPLRVLQRTGVQITKVLQRSQRPDMDALAKMHQGSLAAIDGEHMVAQRHLTEAQELLEAQSMPLYSALCTAALGRLSGIPNDSALLALGVVDPDAILRAHLPGALH